MSSEARVPVDYDPNEEEIIERAALKLAQKVSGRMAAITYHEKGNGGGFQNWVLGIVAILVGAGVVGVVVMYGQLSRLDEKLLAVESQNAQMQAEMAEIRKLVGIHFRGLDDAPPR